MYSSKLSSSKWSSPLCCAAAATVSTSPAVAPRSPHSAWTESIRRAAGSSAHESCTTTGAEERALADTARPVEDGQPVGEDVRRHGGDLTLAAEEEECVELRILERREALVRALREAAHGAAAFSSARSSSAT